MQQILFLINITQSYWMKLWGTNEALENRGILLHRHDRPFSSIWTCLKPLLLREKTLQVTLLKKSQEIRSIYALRSSRRNFEFFETPFYFRFRERLPFHDHACQQTFKTLKLVLTTWAEIYIRNVLKTNRIPSSVCGKHFFQEYTFQKLVFGNQ